MKIEKIDGERTFSHNVYSGELQVNGKLVKYEVSKKMDSIFDDYDFDVDFDKKGLTENEQEEVREWLDENY